MKKMLGRHAFILIMMFTVAGAASSAKASDKERPGKPGSVAVEIVVSGMIPGRCGSAQHQHFASDIGDLNIAGSLEIAFAVDCNAPFVVGVASTNGALVGGKDDGSGFAFRKTYSVGLSVDTDAGELTAPACLSSELARNASVGSCAFRGILPGEGLSSGNATAIGRQGRLTVGWKAGGDGRRLASGRFEDTLTITLGART